VPIAGSNGIIGFHEVANVSPPGVTVGRSGSVGKVAIYEKPFWAHNTCLYVRDFCGNDPRFTYYFLQHLDVGRFKSGASVPTLDRNSFRTLPVAVPPLTEQRQIAAVLSAVQRAIERQERLIALTAELKKALMHKLFTEGTRGEPLKQTEIGPVPESWTLRRCDQICPTISVGVVVKPRSHYVDVGVPAFRSFNVREDRLIAADLVYFSQADNEGTLAKSRLRAGDILIVRTGYPGTSCVVPKEFDGANCIDIIFACPSPDVESTYLSCFTATPRTTESCGRA
jgi:type I restriction enzyme S subunit